MSLGLVSLFLRADECSTFHYDANFTGFSSFETNLSSTLRRSIESPVSPCGKASKVVTRYLFFMTLVNETPATLPSAQYIINSSTPAT